MKYVADSFFLHANDAICFLMLIGFDCMGCTNSNLCNREGLPTIPGPPKCGEKQLKA